MYNTSFLKLFNRVNLFQEARAYILVNLYGTANNLVIGGTQPDIGSYVMYLFTGGGMGGYADGDGLTYGAPTGGLCRQQPYEVFEQLYPVRTRQFSIREGSAGAGKHRGGFGAVIEFEFLGDEAVLSVFGERGKFGPTGLRGGKSGARNEFCIIRSSGEKLVFPFLTKGQTAIRKGDVIQLRTPGGGGYGDPLERERKLILEDIAKGYIDKRAAETEYGAVVDDAELESIRALL